MDEERFDKLYSELCDSGICDLLGEDVVRTDFDKENRPKGQNFNEWIKMLKNIALEIVDLPEFDPAKDIIRFRKIRNPQSGNIIALRVDVIKNNKRYAAGMEYRISTGQRQQERWKSDLTKAVEAALKSKPIPLYQK